MEAVTHLSVPSDFMIVSLPDDAAFTICCSTDLLILALSACITPFSRVYERMEGVETNREREKKDRGPTLCMVACLMAAAFLGAAIRRPFFVLAAALWARRALLGVALD